MKENSNITLVTGLWDIKRADLEEGWKRSFEDHYISKFRQLLELPHNLIVFGDKELKKIVFEKRTERNTVFYCILNVPMKIMNIQYSDFSFFSMYYVSLLSNRIDIALP